MLLEGEAALIPTILVNLVERPPPGAPGHEQISLTRHRGQTFHLPRADDGEDPVEVAAPIAVLALCGKTVNVSAFADATNVPDKAADSDCGRGVPLSGAIFVADLVRAIRVPVDPDV